MAVTAPPLTSWEWANYADPLKLAEFVTPRLPHGSDQRTNTIRTRAKRLLDANEPVDFLDVDELVTALGLHISRVPDHIWKG